MNIYIDGTLINGDYIKQLNDSYLMFIDTFYLGATPCRHIKLVVDFNAINDVNISEVILEENDTQIKMIVEEINLNDENDYEITLCDKMINFEFNYDASKIFVDNQTTIYNMVLDMCEKAGVTLGTPDFAYKNKVIKWYDNTYTARQYIGFIAELNGGYAVVQNGVLYFKKFENIVDNMSVVDVDLCGDITIGEYHKITRVLFDNGVQVYSKGSEDNNTLYINSENLFIDDEEMIETIYNSIKDFEFYSISTNMCYESDYEFGSIIEYHIDNRKYPTICQYENHEYLGNWIGGYILEVETKKQEETEVNGLRENIKNIKVKLNRDEALLNITSTQTTQNGQDIATLQITSGKVTTEIKEAIDKSASDTISTINESITTQTANAIETWFTSSGLDGTLGDLQDAVTNNSDNLQKISAYIRQGIIDNPSSPYYGESYIELGDSTNQTTLRILPERIQFLTNGVETAYISNNTLYITESTILKKEQIGRWITEEDVYGNLNTKWVG